VTNPLARDFLYGKHLRTLAFIIGPGPSISKAEKYLAEPHPHSFRIAINSAITKVRAEYWFFIDEPAYRLYKDHPNAKAAIKIGAENWADHYEPDVYLWEPAKKLPEDVQNLKILHRGCSLIGAMGMASLMGARRIVTVGTENRFTEEYMAAKLEEVRKLEGRSDETIEKVRDYYLSLQIRVNRALNELPFWCPDWVTLRDASGFDSELPLKASSIHKELEMLDTYYSKHPEEAIK
jgi:hypothetical protein